MSIASIVEQQIPSFIRDNSDVPFASFLDSYYRFLSESYTVTLDDLKYTSISLLQNENERSLNSERGEIYHQLTSLKKLRDIDTTTVGLVSNFVSEYMDGVNAPSLDSIRHNMKLMKNFYENKGNENSFHFLFNLLYNEIVTISYPYDKALKLSETFYVKDRTSVRIGTEIITKENLDNAIDTSIGNGILESYSSEVITSTTDNSATYEYYKLVVKNLTGIVSTVKVDDVEVSVLNGLNEVVVWDTVAGYDNSNAYPSEKLEVINDSPPITQYGARIEIDKMTEFELTNSNISGNPVADGRVEIVHDYFTVYEYDDNLTKTIVEDLTPTGEPWSLNVNQITYSQAAAFANTQMDAGVSFTYDGVDAVRVNSGDNAFTLEIGHTIIVYTGDLHLKGEVSGTIAKFENRELNRLWVSNIDGTFLSDYQMNENGGSELVLILDDDGDEIGNLRFDRMYSACISPATVVVKNNSVNVIQGGKGYIFNPYVKTEGLSIIGLGEIEKIKVTDMGIGYPSPTGWPTPTIFHVESGQNYNQHYIINRIISPSSKKQIGYGKQGNVATESLIESTTLNTLDGEAKLRDGNYYQEFSYEILSSVPMETWRYPVKKLLHPAGMKLFGKDITVTSPFDLSLTDQFPSWSDYSDGSDSLIEIPTFSEFSGSAELTLGTIFSEINWSVVENVSLNAYSTTVNGFNDFDSIVNYDDIISETHFASYDSSLAAVGSETISHSFQVVDYHVITEDFQPETTGLGSGSQTFNNNIHSVNYKTLMNDNLYSVDSHLLDGSTIHLVVRSDEFEALGENGENLLLSGFNIHEFKLDRILSEYEGDGLGANNSNELIHEIIIRYSIDTDGDGVGDIEAIAFIYPCKYDTGTPEMEDEASTSSIGMSKYHSIPTYSTYFSGSGSEMG